MKNYFQIYKLLILLFLSSSISYSQCGWFTANTACTSNAPTTIGSSISCTPPSNDGGRRNFVVNNMVAGNTYRISNCGSGFDTQMTIRNSAGTSVGYNDDNGPVCAGTAASIDFVCPATGQYWIQLNRFNCATGDNLNGTITLTLTAVPTFRAEIVSVNYGSSNWCSGETRTVAVTIRNTGTATWTDATPDINIGIKWNTNGAIWNDYHVRTNAGNLASGATQTYSLTIAARNATIGPVYTTNLAAGTNNLRVDVVNEGTCWFGNNSGSCGPGNSVFVTPNINILSSPSAVSVSPISTTICENDAPVLLTATGGQGGIGSTTTLISENFNGTPTGWTTTNNSSSGTPANAAWTLRPNGFVYSGTTFNSNDATQFYLSNSDAQGSGSTTLTTLTSPVFSTVGASSGTINFFHYFRLSDAARVQFSTDGTNFTTITTYTANQGGPTSFSNVSITLPAGALNQPTVYIRFRYEASWDWYWAIDNFSLSIVKPDLIWSPITGLDPDGTGPQPAYSGGNASTLFALPSTTQTYTVTSTSASGCTATASTTITVNPTLNASVSIAASANPACLGNSVTFTATPTNGGSSPSYIWTKNGTPIGGATSVTYTGVSGTDFVSTDQIACILTSNATPCLAGSPATSSAITMTVNAAAPSNTPGTYTSTLVNHLDGSTQTYNFDNCTSLGQITDAAGGNVLGNTTMTSTVAASILTSNPSGYVYLRRGYTISPASDGAMTLKMYFTQQDFDNYNATAVDFLSLPTSGSNADPNIPFFRIATVVGGVHTISGPLGATGLTWNGTHWEFTMNVTSVAGTQYFVTSMPSCIGIAVSNLTPTNVTTDAVTATWTSVVTTPSWGWYGFRYRVVGASTWIDAGTANNPATSRFINGLTPGTNYELQIRRHCSSQSEGPWSSSVFFTTLGGGCGSPMIFNTPTATASSANLTWTAVLGAAWYEFEYKLAASSTWISAGTLIGSGTSRTISGLVTGSTYNYRGRTYCSSGTPSPWSITGTVTISASGCSLPPVISASTISGTSATITWPAVVGAAWYEFRYKQTSSGTWISAGTLGSTATSRVLSGLISGTQYDFQARTYCSSGVPSAWSSTLQFTTSGLAACESAPIVSTSTITGTSATITWSAIPGAGWYEFRYKQTSSGTWITAGTLVGSGTSKTLSGLTPSTQYDFQARTFCNSTSGSAWGSTLQFTTGASAMAVNDEITQVEASSLNNNEEKLNIQSIEVTIYPNPTNSIVNIETQLEQADDAMLVKVMDMSGRLVQLINANSVKGMNRITIDLSTMSNGVYTVELYKANAILSRTKVYKN